MPQVNQPTPPKIVLRLLSWFCPAHLYEEIEGDLIQRFQRDVKLYGGKKAKRRLIWSAIRFLRPGIVLRNKFSKSSTTTIMLKNYFVVATRSFLKRKALNTINVIGISFGISFSLLAILFVKDEFSFDDFHHNKNLIYRTDFVTVRSGNEELPERSIILPVPTAPALKERIRGIDYITRYHNSRAYIHTERSQHREEIQYVDQDFLKMFTLHFVRGNPELCLKDVQQIVISDSKAIKLFGTINVIGKTVDMGERSYTISGVFEDFPDNTSFDPTMLFRYENFGVYQIAKDDWNGSYSSVFVQLNSLVKIDDINKALKKFSDEHFNQIKDRKDHFVLTSLEKMHFDDQVDWLNVSNIKYSYILSGIAFALLFVACVNYILLSLAGSLSRAKEIGVRKVMGATRRMIRFQFFGESLILVSISVCISVVIVSLVLPQFNGFMNRQLGLFQRTGFTGMMTLFGIVMATGIMAGGYPALILSSLIPQKVLKSNTNGSFKSRFSLYLIVLQFSSCFVLLICTLVMLSQMKMIQTKDLGFSRDQVVVVDVTNDAAIPAGTILSNFRSELTMESDIAMISATESFGTGGSTGRLDPTGKMLTYYSSPVDFNFFEMLDMKLTEGRFFSRDYPSDVQSNTIVINESLARQEGLVRDRGNTSLIGQKVGQREIIGIVKDFNFQSLNHGVKPWLFYFGQGNYRQMLVKIQSDNIPSTISKLEKTWTKVVGSGRLQFTFLDDHINKQYERYTQWIRIISISAFLAIAITGLGLLGIISLAVISRTKEIGIRKVLGASISSLIRLFSNQYAILIFLAFIIAIPVADHFSSQWLQEFAYKTEVGLWHYTIPLLLVSGFALVIVVSQVVRTARTNPVDSIRYE